MQMRRRVLWVVWTAVILSLSVASLVQAQRQVIINGKRLSASEIAHLEQRCGPLIDGVYRVQGDYWWNVLNPLHAGRVSQLCNRHRGTYQQGSGTGEVYGNGASAHRNSTVGQGVVIDPNAGGSWQDKVFLSR
jgi:hypothetical protein